MKTWMEEIRRLREIKGLSQAALGHLVGASQRMVSKWENGESSPRGRQAIALAALMGVDIAFLVLSEKSKKTLKKVPA